MGLLNFLGSVTMALSTGLSRTCHLAPSVSDIITLSRPSIPPPQYSDIPLSLINLLYADDTQLRFSSHRPNFDSSITQL